MPKDDEQLREDTAGAIANGEENIVALAVEVALGMVDHADQDIAALVDLLHRERARKLWWATLAIVAVAALVGYET